MSEPRQLTVHYFAGAKVAAGVAQQRLPYVDGERLSELRARLTKLHPPLAGLLPSCRLALEDEFATDEQTPPVGANVYVLPPVSGGAGATPSRALAAIVTRELVAGEAAHQLKTRGAGAVVTFTGVVRDHNQGRSVTHLDFEAHVPLARKELTRIVQLAIDRFDLVDAYAVHRLGHCPLGAPVVDIAVAGAHRPETFDGCRFIIDELKKTVPIWKRETHEDGSEWLSQTP